MTHLWHQQPCPVCAQGQLHVGVKAHTQHYRGRTWNTSIQGAFCDHCGDGIADHSPEEEAAWARFRDSVDAQQAADLARIRKKLKLTQVAAAELAGGGKNAFSRYERGSAKPVAAVTNLFKLLDLRPELLAELR